MAESELTVHVFVGAFADHETACLYSEEQWPPEPGPDATDEARSAWEDAGPTWAMGDELDAYLDSDFIETISGDDRFDYLATELADPRAAERLREEYAAMTTTLVLIGSNALDGRPANFASTSVLTYCGEHACPPLDMSWLKAAR